MQAMMTIEASNPMVLTADKNAAIACANAARRQLLKLEAFVVQQVTYDAAYPMILIDRPLPDLVERSGASCVLSQRGSDGRYTVTVRAFGVDWCWITDKHYAWSGVARPMPAMDAPSSTEAQRGVLQFLRLVGDAS